MIELAWVPFLLLLMTFGAFVWEKCEPNPFEGERRRDWQ